MDILAKLQELVSLIASLQSALADSQAALDEVAAQAKQAGKDEAMAELQPQLTVKDEQIAALLAEIEVLKAGQGDPEKKYSQAELDEAVALAVEAAKSEVMAELDVKIEEAKVSWKAELLAKYEEQQVAESQGETGFADLLK